MEISEELKKFSLLLDEVNISFSRQVESYEQNISKYERKISGVVRPQTHDEVALVVKAANESQVSLYPISVGGNWAFGSRLPVTDGQVILDLSQLNSVKEFDGEMGHVRIEPGVTQGQLSDYLEKKNSNYMLDVTGSGYHTSVIGNALERGIAYNSLRAERILGAKVLLGNGEVVYCGYHSRTDARVKDIYPYGLGPGMDQLFFQSHFGIVLEATYLLHPRQTNRLSIQVKFPEQKLEVAMESFRSLTKEGVIDCIVHSADPYRSASTVCPLMEKSEAQQYYEHAMNSQEWSSIMSVYGPKGILKAKIREVKQRFSGIGKVIVFNEKKIERVKRLLALLGMKKQKAFLEATEGLRGLVSGRATSDALHMAHFDPTFSTFTQASRLPRDQQVEVDSSSMGALFCVPLATYSGESAREMVSIVRKVKEETGLPLGVTLNALTEKVLEAVISLHFPENDADKGHRTFRELNQKLIAKGFLPYRLNPEVMDLLPYKSESTKKTLQRVADIFDPNGTISPGRYEI